jgi:hypothetical protein
MLGSRLLVLALAGALCAVPAWGQDDDDLAPLTPTKKKNEPKAKPKPKPPPAKPAPKPKPAPVTNNTDDELAPLAPMKGELQLKLAASAATRRAKVTIDDKDAGTLPLAAQSLAAGDHVVSVRAPGFSIWKKTLTVTANKTTEITVPLEATAALVSVTADSSGAEVLINGKGVGTAPVEELEVPPGSTTIVVRKEGYKDASTTVKLVAGREYPISIKLGAPAAATNLVAQTDRPENTNLTPANTETPGGLEGTYEPTPVYKRWYVWVGAAAVVAAVAVGVAVGVNSSKPHVLSDKEICGGACDACIGFMCGMSASGITKF